MFWKKKKEEPTDPKLIDVAVKFLENPKIDSISKDSKIQFLKKKGWSINPFTIRSQRKRH